VNAALAQLGMAGATSVGVITAQLNWKQVVVVAISGGAVGALLYLKQSPLPPVSTGDTEQFKR